MKRSFVKFGSLAAVMASSLIGACDSDPARPAQLVLSVRLLNTGSVAPQDPLRFLVVNGPPSPQAALDQANVVITNQCNGLRIPGSLRLSGDTIIFTPGSALPFLIRVGIRIQNLLTVSGQALPVPFVTSTVTEAPPVSDISWQLLNSPTNDILTGVTFPDRNIGFLLAVGGAVYRTDNGGVTFAARFKSADFSTAFDLQAFGTDTLFMVTLARVGGTHFALVRSIDAAQNFVEIARLPAFPLRAQFRRAGTRVVGEIGGQSGVPVIARYNSGTGGVTTASGMPSNYNFGDVGLSPNADRSFVVLGGTIGTSEDSKGRLYASSDSGLSFAQVNLGSAPVYVLRGGGFADNTTVVVGGDSSQVFRVNLQTGAVTRLGLAEGIPQSESNAAGARTLTYSFSRARFVPNSQVGWLIGQFRRAQAGLPDVVGGIILITRDGGQHYTRQAIAGAPDNGLSFPALQTLDALAVDFVSTAGVNGLVAARKSDSQVSGQACSLLQP